MSGIRLSRRLDGVSESATLRLNALANAKKARGEDVVNLTAGEPDFPPSEAAKAGARRAIETNQNRYTPVAGLAELRAAIADRTNRAHPSLRGRWSATNVLVSNGGKQALFNSFLALLDPGDEVIIPAPYWLSYPEMVKLASGTPRILDCPRAEGYLLSPKRLSRALGPRTRALILNFPSNPTGALYSEAELKELGAVLADSECLVLSDEIYDRIVFDGAVFKSFVEACPGLADRTVTVNGLSKSGAMTGWRVGWSVAGEKLTAAMTTIQGQSTSGINALAQWAAIAALGEPESAFQPQLEAYARRRDLAVAALSGARGLDLFRPAGAFYVFLDFSGFLARRADWDSARLCEELLERAGVAIVPGGPFGAPACARLSFAIDEKTLQKGCERIVEFLAKD